MAGGVPGITKYARQLGDYSSIKRRERMPFRAFNRMVGRSGGKAIHFAQASFGVVGLVAVAEFFHFMKRIVNLRASGPVWFGSMTNYAMWVDRGWTHPASGTQVAPVAYFTKALKQAEDEISAYGGGFRRPRLAGKHASAETKIRTGIYEGQKFLGDLGQFYRDASPSGIAGRFIRREAGRQSSGFLFSALKEKKNPIEKYVILVLKHAKSNLKGHIDTGLLRASLAMGTTENDFVMNSINQAMAFGVAHGMTQDQVYRKLATSQSRSGDRFVTLKGPAFAARTGQEMPA